jgi:hypothetical protein
MIPLTRFVPEAQAANPSDLFFSEYIEGSSNNKALEIYNGTGAPVNLGTLGYKVEMYFNGATTPVRTVNLTGTVASGDVFVLAHGSANATIKAQADQLDTTTANWYNGNDAVVLKKGSTIVDVIGQIGNDPGTEWGTGFTSTADNTLRRKPTFCTGDTNPNDSFNPATEWDGFAQDTFGGLGAHTTFCNETAPAVQSTSPASGGSNVDVDSNISVTFNEPVTVTGGWFSLSCSLSGSHSATYSGSSTTYTINPDADFFYNETCTVTVLKDFVTDQDADDPPDNMAANYSWSFTTPAVNPCSASYTPIPKIQGSTGSTQYAGQTVTTRGVVTGDFQGSSKLSGFFLQDAAGDGNSATSDGIFIFVPNANPLSSIDVSVGDEVVVTGDPKEFNSMTEMDFVTTIKKCGTGSVAPTSVDLPEETNGDLERYEGMLVTFPETLTVSQNFFLGRYGQLTLSSDGRLFNPTNSNLPGSPGAISQADENARRQIFLDDGSSVQNPASVPYLFGADNTLRSGDTVAGLTGVLDYGLVTSDSTTRDYRVQPTVAPVFNRDNPRTAAPEPVGGNVKVASFNVLNYFNGNGSGLAGAAGGFPTSRGADTLVEFNRQRAKIIAAITAIDPDVAGLIEVENDGGGPTSAIQDLVNGLNSATAPGTYAFRIGTTPGTDEIQNAIIYKPSRVTPVGAAVNDVDTDGDNAWAQARNPLAQTFQYNANGEKFTFIVNHFTSKGCSASDTGADADQGDGQGCDNYQRTQQAERLLTFIADRQAASGDDDILVMGDLNAYGKEDPIRILTDGGMVNQIEAFITNPYSYIFGGTSGYIDQALTTTSLSSQVTGVTEWHINADEPVVMDYNTEFNPAGLYTPTPYRSADHDPLVIGLDLNAPPTVDAGGPYTVAEGSSVTVSATVSDVDGDSLSYAWDLDNDGNFETSGQSVSFSAASLDGPSSHTIKVQVSDGKHTVIDEATVNVTNVAPTVGSITVTPNPVLVNGTVNTNAGFTDPGTPDTHTALWSWGDSNSSAGVVTETNGSGSVTGSHSYGSVGSYTVTLTVTDDDLDSGQNMAQVQVTYGILALFDQTKAAKSGSTIPIKLQLVDANGNNLSASNKTVNVVAVKLNSVAVAGTDYDSGNANPDNNFRFDPTLGGYIFNLSTKNLNLGTGDYTLYFTVSGDPVVHTVNFKVK